METNDPDEFLTLLLLIGHPRVNLKAVTVTPSTPDQIGLVRHAVNDFPSIQYKTCVPEYRFLHVS